MHYSKRALLIFGAGAILGLIVVSANLGSIGRAASVAMAAGIVLVPFALVADWWSHRPWRTPAPKPKSKKTAKRRAELRSRRPARPPPPRKRGPRGK